MKNLKPSLAEATVIRPFIPLDLNFIANSWSNQIKKHLPFSSWTDDQFREHVRVLMVPFLNPKTCFVLADKAEEGLILSWLCGSIIQQDTPIGVLHFGYTKSSHRNLGYFSALYEQAFGNLPVFCSHYTPNMERHHKEWGYRPNPYLTFLCL